MFDPRLQLPIENGSTIGSHALEGSTTKEAPRNSEQQRGSHKMAIIISVLHANKNDLSCWKRCAERLIRVTGSN
ncbi:hypothetical protein I7I53_08004 [Histoplasma capsulatum var. duboisii H88]|uniref:Uncharacterized protein n=1 Tax=Ajellomyces capsulatus (strain H88) TaxID=544711 RepID=A0A8A1LER9_AJEC8|nr:hypothetical protein I7I53_08004 [Histoplasma capsulatum var. duboisii H88]